MKIKEVDTSNYLFSGNDLKKLIIPLIIEQFLAIFVGLADSIMVASVGEAAVSSVSLVDTFMVLFINIFAALGTGGAVVAGQYIGKKKLKDSCRATDQMTIFIVWISLAITLIMYLCKDLILTGVFGKIDADVMYNCNIYFLIVTASIPFIALYNSGAAIFRAMGNSKIPMYMALFMNALNLIGNAILIYGFHMGIEGAAIPTLLSRIVAGIGTVMLLTNQDRQLHFSKPFSIKIEWSMLKKILNIGIPNGLENSMFQLGKILVLSMVSGFGTASIAANAVGNNVAMFMILPGLALGYAMLSVVAQCAGAGDYEQVKYYTKKLMKWNYGLFIISNGAVVLLLPFILKAYGLSPEATQIARQIVWYHGICCVTIWPFSFALPNTLRASNDVKFCMILAIVSMWIFRIGFSYLLGDILGWGVFGIWVAMTVDWLFRAICFAVRYCRGKWMLHSI
ncbi:MAG: MATE family efflux transporter [Lachnospiraceae bacterium]|jgi:putative MATE family efflux protein|nr:MATE family efflux transporter [Lachnospiraceae bacterium]MDD3617387.1 MATE family efflux transporter [Lachnospiraceae bacterium]